MKKLYSLILFSFIALLANATVHTISVASFQFTPATTSANCGDTIKWVWASGTHTASSTTIPVGAAPWNANMNSTSTTFTVQVTVVGNYSFQCNIHTSMQGTIIVQGTCTNGVPSINSNYLSSAYPSPFSNKLIIETSDADMISLYNIMGEKINTMLMAHGQSKTEINTTDLRNGIYFYAIIKEGVVIETRKIVKN